MFHLPLHQSYGYRIQNKRTFCATERAVESTVVLPIATCVQTLWHKASAISYQHATSVDQALYEYRHDAPAVVVESKAQVMVSIGYLYTTTSTNSTRNVLPQATCTLQWQRPDCMFEEEVMRNVCVSVQHQHVVPFQPAVQVSFYPRIVVTTNNNDELLPAILASYQQQQQQQQQYYHHQNNNNTTNATTTMQPYVVLGNVRMTVRVASLNHTTTTNSSRAGNPFDGSMTPTSSVSAAAAAAVVPNDHEEEEYTWQAILPLEAYIVTPPPPQGGTASGPVQIPGMCVDTTLYSMCCYYYDDDDDVATCIHSMFYTFFFS
jgi:hypothetical protein